MCNLLSCFIVYRYRTDCIDRYKKAELKSFLQFHREGEEPLRDDEASRFIAPSDLPLILSCRAGLVEYV